jgi:hypothetical protein
MVRSIVFIEWQNRWVLSWCDCWKVASWRLHAHCFTVPHYAQVIERRHQKDHSRSVCIFPGLLFFFQDTAGVQNKIESKAVRTSAHVNRLRVNGVLMRCMRFMGRRRFAVGSCWPRNTSFLNELSRLRRKSAVWNICLLPIIVISTIVLTARFTSYHPNTTSPLSSGNFNSTFSDEPQVISFSLSVRLQCKYKK